MKYQEIITLEADKRFGKPCIRGMRIAVYDVLHWLGMGMTFEEILEEYDELTKDDILACLQYSADKERITKIAA